MPDDLNNQAAGEGADGNKGAGAGEGQGEGADQNKKPDATDTGGEDAGKGEGEGAGGAKDTSKGQEGQKNAKAPTKKEGSQEKGKIDDQEPEVRSRLSTQDFIIGRQRAKLAKKGEGGGEGKGDEGGEDEDEIAPEDEELITKVVAKKFAPILDKTIAAEDDKEIAAFLKENPDFAPYEAKARKYIAHPSRRHLPIKAVFYEVAGDDLIKIGADRKGKADKEAKDTQTGGGSNRAGEGAGKSDWDLSPEEFAAKQEKVRKGQ